MTSPEDWTALASRDRAVATSGVWEKHFGSWAAGGEERARADAVGAFAPLADAFMATMRAELTVERQEIQRWAEGRADEICGQRQRQLEFGMDTSTVNWRTASEASERLAGYASDATVPSPRRQEAAGVLKLLQDRLGKLERREHCVALPPMTLGLLMIVPVGVRP